MEPDKVQPVTLAVCLLFLMLISVSAVVAGLDEEEHASVPRHAASLGAAVKHSPWRLSGVLGFESRVSGPEAEIGSQLSVDLDLAHIRYAGRKRILHSISVKNPFDDELLVPEYVRRKGLNAVPLDHGRRILYIAKVLF